MEGAKQKLTDALVEKIAEARAEGRKKGWTYQGAKRAVKVSPFAQAVTYTRSSARGTRTSPPTGWPLRALREQIA